MAPIILPIKRNTSPRPHLNDNKTRRGCWFAVVIAGSAGAQEPQAKVTLGRPLQPAGACSPVSSPLPQPRALPTPTPILLFLPHCQLTHRTVMHLSAQPPATLSSTGQSQGPRIRNQGTPRNALPLNPLSPDLS